MREDDGADEAELARIDEIARCKVASEKIRLAGEVLPNSLKMEGDNILLLLHDQLSYGIHSGDEDWCGEVHELPARPKLRARRAGGGAEEERGPQGGRGGRQDVQAREDREGAG